MFESLKVSIYDYTTNTEINNYYYIPAPLIYNPIGITIPNTYYLALIHTTNIYVYLINYYGCPTCLGHECVVDPGCDLGKYIFKF